MIRQAVGPAIGAAPDSVAIVDINGHAYPGGSADSVNNNQDRYLNTKHQYEREYADSLRPLLSFVKGAIVTVNVELHPEVEETESTDHFEPKSTPPEVSENTKPAATGISLPSGIMNVATQGGIPNSPLTVAETGNGLRTDNNSTQHHDRDPLSRQSRQVRKVGLTPKSVTVSVGIPSSYYEEVCQQRFPSPSGLFAKKLDPSLLGQVEADVNNNIKRTVLGIIPPSEVSANDAVTITSFTSMPVAEIEKATPADQALLWLTDHANAVGMGLLVVVSLLIVRSIVRNLTASHRAEIKPRRQPPRSGRSRRNPSPNQSASPRRRARFPVSWPISSAKTPMPPQTSFAAGSARQTEQPAKRSRSRKTNSNKKSRCTVWIATSRSIKPPFSSHRSMQIRPTCCSHKCHSIRPMSAHDRVMRLGELNLHEQQSVINEFFRKDSSPLEDTTGTESDDFSLIDESSTEEEIDENDSDPIESNSVVFRPQSPFKIHHQPTNRSVFTTPSPIFSFRSLRARASPSNCFGPGPFAAKQVWPP